MYIVPIVGYSTWIIVEQEVNTCSECLLCSCPCHFIDPLLIVTIEPSLGPLHVVAGVGLIDSRSCRDQHHGVTVLANENEVRCPKAESQWTWRG